MSRAEAMREGQELADLFREDMALIQEVNCGPYEVCRVGTLWLARVMSARPFVVVGVIRPDCGLFISGSL